jgi:hypothetical protein
MDLKKSVEINLTLPERSIDELYFNEQKTRAVFEKQDDGWFYSRDILFMSARNAKDDNSRDILTEYLNDFRIRAQIAATFNVSAEAIIVALPRENQGIKKYHSIDCWYWLADPRSGSTANFCIVHYGGRSGNYNASSVGGCSPAFRVEKETTI